MTNHNMDHYYFYDILVHIARKQGILAAFTVGFGVFGGYSIGRMKAV
ncbi:MAG: hypothetical protein WAZ77_03830 [Candidatus Nitrosopolaris sp.]